VFENGDSLTVLETTEDKPVRCSVRSSLDGRQIETPKERKVDTGNDEHEKASAGSRNPVTYILTCHSKPHITPTPRNPEPIAASPFIPANTSITIKSAAIW
jgi:hypothetical protein